MNILHMPQMTSQKWAVLWLALGVACSSQRSQAITTITVYSSSAAKPWLESAYACVPQSSAIKLSDDPSADAVLRLGEPETLTLPTYQIGVDDLLVVTHPQTGIGPLTVSQVQALFAGQFVNWSEVGGADLPVQVWVFDPSADVQTVFDRAVMYGRPITSLARLAVSAQHMSDSVGSVDGSIGVLPRRWKTGNVHEALLFASSPVLMLVSQEPRGDLAALIACMQTRE